MRRGLVVTGGVVLLSCAIAAMGLASGPSSDAEEGLPRVRPEAIRAHLAFLADDALGGRGTGSPGYELAAKYIRAQLMAFGATSGPGHPDSFQNVPLVRTRVDPQATRFEVKGPGAARQLVYGTDYVLLDTHRDSEGGASARVVFVGYGVTAPELGYDDYAGLDVKGAIVAYLEFESPPTFAPAVRAHYADHDGKRANAARHGAIGVIEVRSPAEESRLPWAGLLRELQTGWNSLRWLDVDGTPGGLNDQVRVLAILNRSGADVLFGGEAHEARDVFAAAEKGRPPRFTLSKTVTAHFGARHERVESVNVVAAFPGSDPTLRNEYVVYTAHVDHLGIGPVVDGDTVYNGAMDNAAGCAVLLEVARAFGALPERPRRSVMFVFVTGEEAGLLGSDYFAHHPPVPLDRIVANINIDGGASLVPVSDVIAWGAQHSTLGGVAMRAATRVGLSVSPDPFPEEGLFVRSDQYSFVKFGVPALFISVGVKGTTPGVDALAVLKKWLVTTYHSPKDDVTQPIHYETSAKFAGFAFVLGHTIAMESQRPRWNDNDFFERRRTLARAVLSTAPGAWRADPVW